MFNFLNWKLRTLVCTALQRIWGDEQNKISASNWFDISSFPITQPILSPNVPEFDSGCHPHYLSHTPYVTGIIREVIPMMPFEIHWKLLLSLTRRKFESLKSEKFGWFQLVRKNLSTTTRRKIRYKLHWQWCFTLLYGLNGYQIGVVNDDEWVRQ